jgi:hypothetical protein
MMIARLGLAPDRLHGETVLVTGAGGGIIDRPFNLFYMLLIV